MPHLEVPGAVLYYETDGHPSSPAILLVPAGVANLRMWDPFVPTLTGDHFVVRFDPRGYGLTVSEDVEYSDREDASSVLSHVGVERACVVGASRGGGVAVDLALDFPDRVSGLVLVGVVVDGVSDEPATDAQRAVLDRMAVAEEQEDWSALIDLEVQLWTVGAERDASALDRRFLETAHDLHRANLPRMTESPVERELEPAASGRLSDIAVPSLVIVGGHDIADAQRSFDHVAASIADAASARIENAAHLPSVEQPAEFARIVSDWLESHHL